MRLAPLLLATTLSLAACAGGGQAPLGIEYGRLTLHRPLAIPANSASVRLQYGRATAFNAVQEQEPFCVFEVETVADQSRAVPPGSYPITAVGRSVETFAGMPVHTIFPTLFGRNDTPTHIYYKTQFRLHDPRGTVRALTCMYNQNTPATAFMGHLTVPRISEALGSAFTLDWHGRP